MIRVSQLVKRYAGTDHAAVDGISFEVPKGAMVTLLGPSGCGKSTTLRMIAGLERPDAGVIEVGDRTMFSSDSGVNVRVNRRNMGMVFQSYAIWPHMTVFENVAYPLRRDRSVSRKDVRPRVMKALEMVGLEDFAGRAGPNLSGGQQQRVALARALVGEPEVLLLDEPLSNLDSSLRESMRWEIRELQQRLGITALYVTHDQTEALGLSDFVSVMSAGRIVDFGEPARIYDAPGSRFVAEFMGLANIIPVTGTTTHPDGGKGMSPLGEIEFSDTAHATADTSRFLVRLEDVELLPVPGGAPTEPNVWVGSMVSSIFLGNIWDCVIDVAGFRVRTHAPRRQQFKVGDRVGVRIHPGHLVSLKE